MFESSPRKICLTVLLEINEDRASRGLPPLSSKDWAESLERNIDSMMRQAQLPEVTDSCTADDGTELHIYERLKAMQRPSS